MAFFGKSSLERQLRKIVGKKGLLTRKADVACYGFDSGGFEKSPAYVVLPEEMDQISRVLSLCNSLGVPVTPRGAGSATTGAAVPEEGGVVICFSRMNRIVSIDPAELTATVQPGVVTGVLQKEVEKLGLFYPPDPASLSFCTIGGNIATGAGGPRAVKYGVTRDYVRSLKVVLADGSVIKAGASTAKGVVGYDLARLFVGSEGTLGVVAEAILRLVPLPSSLRTLAAMFPSVESCVESVSLLFSSGYLPRCAEFLDANCLEAVSGSLPFEVPVGSRALLLVEVDGDESSVRSQVEAATSSMTEAGALKVVQAQDISQREELWRIRRGLSPALRRLGFDSKVSEDVCVPRRRIRQMLAHLERIDSGSAVRIYCFGHIGDGNLHVNLLFNRSQLGAGDLERIVASVMEKAVELDGTISGEHGIGLSKRSFIHLELDRRVLSLERSLKKVFDPNGILNPGKVF